MNIITESKLINLTSQSATQYLNGSYLSNITFDTPGLLINSNNLVNVEISLIHAEIPVSFYTINYTNNQFKIKLDTDPETIYSVPVGNYNANSLILALLNLLNDSNFHITISKITGILTFSHNKPFIIYTDIIHSIGSILGFDINTSYSSTLNSISAPYPLNLLGIKKLNINSSKLISNNFSSKGGSTSLLSSLSVTEPPFGLIVYQNQSGNRFTLRNKEIHNIDLQIFDEDYNYINFNNINWSFLFCIFVTYDLSIPSKLNITDNILPSDEQKKTNEKQKPNQDLQQIEFLTENNTLTK